MDLQQILHFHLRKWADVTISALPVPLNDASTFGVIQVHEKQRVTGFKEKSKRPKPIPGRPNEAFASMGNYLFNKDALLQMLYDEAANVESAHYFGKDILPRVFNKSRVFAYDFRKNRIPSITRKEIGYWRDVGTIKVFSEANMGLRNIKHEFNLYNKNWPIKNPSFSNKA
jgi:glucose-1-phosphate adenylyltransferase